MDGDGSVIINRFHKRNGSICKPTLQIGMTNFQTINYLADIFSSTTGDRNDKRGDRKPSKRIRLMSMKLIEFLPKIIPYLIFKKELAILALEICQLRQDMPNGSHDHPNILIVREKIELLKQLNKDKYL